MDAPYIVMTQAVEISGIVLIPGKLVRVGMEQVQSPAHGTNPQVTGPVFQDACDGIMTQAVGVLGMVLMTGKLAAPWMKSVQPTLVANPQHPGTVFINVPDNIIT